MAEQFDPKERILKLYKFDGTKYVFEAEQFDPKERILKQGTQPHLLSAYNG